jgi:hypothetical protein
MEVVMCTITQSTRRLCRAASTIGLLSLLFAAPATAQTITIGLACGAPGTSVWFDVTLDPQGSSISATQNDISFNSANSPIATCTGADAPTQDLGTNFLPNGCTGAACTTIRGIVASLSDQWAIVIPTVIYRCRVDIPASAVAGNYPLYIQNVSGSDPASNPKSISGVNGQISVTSGSCGC